MLDKLMSNAGRHACQLSTTDAVLLAANSAAFGTAITLLLRGVSGVPVVLLLIGTGLSVFGKLVRVCIPARRC